MSSVAGLLSYSPNSPSLTVWKSAGCCNTLFFSADEILNTVYECLKGEKHKNCKCDFGEFVGETLSFTETMYLIQQLDVGQQSKLEHIVEAMIEFKKNQPKP